MHPETQLAIVAAYTGFLLKSSLGFCICWAISRAVAFPHRKFLAWFGYLFLVGCYWLWLLVSLVPHAPPALASHALAPLAAGAPVGSLQLAAFWVSPLSILLCALGCLYLAILAYFLFVRIKKHLQLRWILQFTYPPPETIKNIFTPAAERLGAGKVRLLMLSGISSPATFGWIKPIILLPPVCLEEDERELKDILLHELQHIRRRDFVFGSIASLCCSLLFFHPAAWYAMRRIRLESELACDLAVVGNSPERRATYAECLVRFARLRVAQEATPWNLDFAGSSVQLKTRIRSMLAGTKIIPRWMLGLRAALGLVLLIGFLAAAPSLFVVFSYEQAPTLQPEDTAEPEYPALPAAQLQPRLRNGSRFRSATRARITHASPVPLTSPTDVSPSVPVETAVAAAPIAPRKSGRQLSTANGPTLKRRGDPATTGPSGPAPGTIILLANPASSDSTSSLARGASVLSAITAGTSEAAQVASRGRDKGTH
jgi:beta-lactamase regulating signal transducer with metallopeptidase domain